MQVAGDAADRPALRVEVDDRQPPLARVRDLGVRRVTPGAGGAGSSRLRTLAIVRAPGRWPSWAKQIRAIWWGRNAGYSVWSAAIRAASAGEPGRPRRVGLGASKPLRPASSNSRAAR